MVKGTIAYFVKTGEDYNNFEEPFKITIVKDANTTTVTDSDDGSLSGNLKNRSLFWIFIAAFGGGLLALLTPCVFSMIPVTVSFFTKRSKNRQEGIKNAFYYSLSIILIFTLLGFLVVICFM